MNPINYDIYPEKKAYLLKYDGIEDYSKSVANKNKASIKLQSKCFKLNCLQTNMKRRQFRLTHQSMY